MKKRQLEVEREKELLFKDIYDEPMTDFIKGKQPREPKFYEYKERYGKRFLAHSPILGHGHAIGRPGLRFENGTVVMLTFDNGFDFSGGLSRAEDVRGVRDVIQELDKFSKRKKKGPKTGNRGQEIIHGGQWQMNDTCMQIVTMESVTGTINLGQRMCPYPPDILKHGGDARLLPSGYAIGTWLASKRAHIFHPSGEQVLNVDYPFAVKNSLYTHRLDWIVTVEKDPCISVRKRENSFLCQTKGVCVCIKIMAGQERHTPVHVLVGARPANIGNKEI